MDLAHLLLIVVGLSVGLLLLSFWIWMLIDCLLHEPTEGHDRLVWLIVIIATKVIGAAIYFFVRRPQRMRLQAG